MCRKVTAQPARGGAMKIKRKILENLAGFLWSLALFPPIDFLYIKRYNKALTEHTALVENLQREGGETMALEAVKLVAQAEQQSKDRKLSWKPRNGWPMRRRLARKLWRPPKSKQTQRERNCWRRPRKMRRRMRQRSNSRPMRTVLHYGPTRKSGLKKRRH